MTFHDHFSASACAYARYRPGYPPTLFAYLASLVTSRGLAWDCGTGSGQAAVGLADHFRRVVATDPSAEQIEKGFRHPRVRFVTAELPNEALADGSVDLVTAAQALHWFDLTRFYAETRRVLTKHGVLAVWCYSLLSVSRAVDPIIEYYYRDILAPYWPPERETVETGYSNLDFPFPELEVPSFSMNALWKLSEFLGYLSTWSSAGRYRSATGRDPIAEVREPLRAAWGDPEQRRMTTWPIHLRAARL